MSGHHPVAAAATAPLPPIQMLWVRGALSRLELLSITSFLAQGHPVHLYTYDPPPNPPAGVELRDAAEVVSRERVPSGDRGPFANGTLGSFSDLFRYTLLDAIGGWWSDVDVVCVRPWRFGSAAMTASTEEKDYGRVANTCVMRFPPGHPVIRRCREQCARFDLPNVGISATGPNLLHHQLASADALSLCTTPDVFCPVPWNASWQLVRPVWQRFTWDELKQRIRRPHLSCRFSGRTVAVHLWNETWRASGRDKSRRYPRTSLYERLQRRYSRGQARPLAS